MSKIKIINLKLIKFSSEIQTWNNAMRQAIALIQYINSSTICAWSTAKWRNCGFFMKTKNNINEIMQTTNRNIPVNRPLCALAQST